MKLISLIMLFVLSTLGLSACSTEAHNASTKGVEHVVKASTQPTTQPSTEAKPAKECQEDEPCWDCHTMGNKVCGPDQPTKVTAKPKANPAPRVAPVQPSTAPVQASQPTASTQDFTAALYTEAARYNHYNYIPRDEYTSVTYLGTSTVDRTNGDDIYSVRSEVLPTLWHSYRIVDNGSAPK